MYKQKFIILLIEDNPVDIKLIKESFIENEVKINFIVCNDGFKAIDFLKNPSKNNTEAAPDLIMLDLKLPDHNGYEILEYIKNMEVLKRIPVIVFTSSQSDKDILKSYDLHANCYIVKPTNYDSYLKIAKTIKDFWFSIVRLPSVHF